MLSTRFPCLSNVNLVYIHQLIVAAIRELGGRFLEYDEQSQTYHDIGNKRAWDKTSQALREGLTKIRREVYSDVAAGRYQSLGSPLVELPVEGYFGFCIQVLKSLHEIKKLMRYCTRVDMNM